MAAVPVAFYAPLKSPDHPAPSGDRTMARLLVRALAEADFAPSLASGLRSFEPTGDEGRQRALCALARAEADRLSGLFEAEAESRPALWFTYHLYYKAPDHIGPRVARRLGIPYVVAEASRAGKRAGGRWAFGHEAAERAIEAADLILVINPGDREALERARPDRQRLVDLPPFLDMAGRPDRDRSRPIAGEPPRLLAVAMMREGDKLESYRRLAGALQTLVDQPWSLSIVGDGPARPAIERVFAAFGSRVRFHGEIGDAGALAQIYAEADLFVWPAINEAYGMVLLEAQAGGCPVVAGGYGGVAGALRPGITGVMTAPGDNAAFAEAVAALLADPARRRAMGSAARRFIATERSLPHGAAILRDTLRPLVARPAVPA